MPLLRLRGVQRHFGDRPRIDALRGIDLSIPQGSYIAIEGESGGGKSTLLNIIGLLDRPSAGFYTIDDRDVAGLSERELSAARSDVFAFVFQSFHLLERRPAVESVEMGLFYRGISAVDRRRRALEALAKVGLGDFAWTAPRNLSGGQRQRVAVARALASGAPVVVADEPTGNLDSENSRAVIESFNELRRLGATVIVVTHSASVAEHAQLRIRVVDGVNVSRRPSSDAPDQTDSSSQVLPLHPPGTASTVRLLSLVRDAWANIASRPSRAAGQLAAIAVSLALAITTLGLAGSAKAQVSSDFDTVASREVTVATSPDENQSSAPNTADALKNVQRLHGVNWAALISETGDATVRVASPRDGLTVKTYDAIGELPQAMRMSVIWADRGDHVLRTDEALVGVDLAKQLSLAPVDLSPTIEVGGRVVSVVGVIHKSPRMPELLGQVMLGADQSGKPIASPTTLFLLTRIGAASQVGKEAPLAVNPQLPSTIHVTVPVAASQLRATVEGSVSASLAILTIVSLIAALITVITAALVSVAERNAEIGLRRALGARRIHVNAMLVSESMILGATGGLAGSFLGLLSILIFTVSRRWTPVFDTSLVSIAIGAGLTMACLGALVGALKAGSVTPSEALRS